MDSTVLAIFAFVYLGMFLGEVPGLALDRAGVALLGAITLLVAERVTPEAAWNAVDVPTLALLFGLMVVSAQFRLGRFYSFLTRRMSAAQVSPSALLGMVVASAGILSALLANDIVCLAMAPVLAEGCSRRGLDPVPFLLALACSANVGSAATLIGNPQNMLIGQTLHLSFAAYLLDALVPAGLGLLAVWWVIRSATNGKWHKATTIPPVPAPDFNLWQSIKALTVLLLLVAAFLFTAWPREVLALAAAGILLTSRKMASRLVLGLVDWQLLVLFVGLFVVNHALIASGTLPALRQSAESVGVNLSHAAPFFVVSVLLSNLVSNVPAVMFLLPSATHPSAGPILALSSTLAGNLLIVGSIANIIVVDQAAQLGLKITWRDHARIGIPVTLLTLLIAAAWLAVRAA